DVDVVLKEPEVHSRRVEIVEGAERTTVDELADLCDRTAEQERVIHHQLEILPFGELDELLRLLGGRGERLFEKDMLAVFERRLRQGEMRPDRSHDGDGVDIGRGQYVGEFGRQLDSRICP